MGLSVVSGFVLIPLYLQYISLGTYGAWLASGNILVWITSLDPGLTSVVEQRVAYFFGKGERSDVSFLLAASIVISICISILVLLLGIGISYYVTDILRLGIDDEPDLIRDAFRLAAAASAIFILNFAIYGINKGLQGSVGPGFVTIVGKGSAFVTTIVLLLTGYGLMAIPWAMALSATIQLTGNGAYLYLRSRQDGVPLKFSVERTLSLARLLGYNFTGRASHLIASNLDSFLLARYLGAEIVPVYQLTKKVPDLVKMLINRISVSFMPATSHLIGVGDRVLARDVLTRLFKYVIWTTGGFLGAVLVFNEAFVSLWVGTDLYAGDYINALICIFATLSIISLIFGNACHSLGAIQTNSRTLLIQSAVYAPLAYIGSRYFGLDGMIWASILAISAVSLWRYPWTFIRSLVANNEHVRPLLNEYLRPLFIEAVASICIMIPLVWVFSFGVYDSAWQLTIMMTGFIACYALGIVAASPSSRKELSGLASHLHAYRLRMRLR